MMGSNGKALADLKVPVESWAWRFFLGGIFASAIAIAPGQALMVPAVLLLIFLACQGPWPLKLLAFLLGASAFLLPSALEHPAMGAALLAQIVYMALHRRAWRLTGAYAGASVFLLTTVIVAYLQPELARGWDRLSSLRWLMLIPAAATWAVTEKNRRTALTALAAGCTALALRTLIHNPLGAWSDLRAGEVWATRFGVALIHRGSINDGHFLMLGLLATLGLLELLRMEERPRRLWQIALAVQTAAFIVNLKRGSWLCAVPLAAVFLLWRARARAKSVWKPLLALWVVLAATLLLPAVRYRLAQLGDEMDPERGGRLTMWTEAAPGLIRDHPWGIGFGQLDNDKMRQYAPAVEEGRSHLHANIPQVLVDNGWVGLAVYVLWMGGCLVAAIRRVRDTEGVDPRTRVLDMTFLLLFVAILGNGLVEYNFGDTRILMALCVIMGFMPRSAAGKQSVALDRQER